MKSLDKFQSSFELTGYITQKWFAVWQTLEWVSKLFRAYGLYNSEILSGVGHESTFQSSFELTGYITIERRGYHDSMIGFQSSFELTGYITIRSRNDETRVRGFQSSFELTGYITY